LATIGTSGCHLLNGRLLASGYEKIQRGAHGISETERLRTVLKDSTLDGLQGRIVMDPNLQHLWQWLRIGRVDKHGQLVTLWQSAGAMPPRFSTVSSCAIGVLRRDKMSSRRTIPLIGKNKAFIDCVNLARVAAETASNIMISGETGTGKDLFAQEIHANSNRWDKPYVPINCVTIPKDLISSELFGYEEGTFTGARTGGRIGKFEAANGGTLFLDEIGEMSYEMQASLLRVIENKEIYRVGGTQAIQLDLRLIAATNRNLEKEIEHCCTFRKDLYYRLSVFHIQLPPIRHRLDDIPLLADHFLTQLCLQSGHRKVFLPETIDLMIGYPWPGNVRELKNTVERAFYLSLSSREIRPEYLPEWIAEKKCAGEDLETVYPSVDEAGFDDNHHPQKSASVRKIPEKYGVVTQKRHELSYASIKENEKSLIEAVLRDNQCNITKTSASLGIARNTLYRKLRKYNICLSSR
jgi:transcriptional regulator with PAS, ATPase and Fis domain